MKIQIKCRKTGAVLDSCEASCWLEGLQFALSNKQSYLAKQVDELELVSESGVCYRKISDQDDDSALLADKVLVDSKTKLLS